MLVNGKKAIIDIHAAFNDGEQADLEVQNHNDDGEMYFLNRAFAYGCRLVSSQLHSGESWKDLKKCYQISILNYRLFKDDEDFHHKYNFYDSIHKNILDILQMHIYEMKKFKVPETTENLNSIEKWSILFLGSEKKEFQPLVDELIVKDREIRMAYDNLNRISEDEKAWAYEFSLFKGECDERARTAIAEERGFNKGVAQGIEQGIAKQKDEDKKIIDEKDSVIKKLMAEVESLKASFGR